MTERSIVITEKDGSYQIHNSIFNDFELLGLFEQIVFDLKYSRTRKLTKEIETEAGQIPEPISSAVEAAPTATPTAPTAAKEKTSTTKTNAAPERIAGVTASAATDLRTRIGNAVKAISDLGGRVENTDLSRLTDEELQIELEELTAQYKRLKNTKGNK